MTLLEEKPVRLQPWVVVLLISLLMAMLTGMVEAGMVMQGINDIRERVSRLETRLDIMETRGK